MDIKALLKTKKCNCGMEHNCGIKEVIIEAGAIRKIVDLVTKYKNILIVADNNTYAVCGDDIKNSISDRIESIQIFETDGYLVPDEKAIKVLTKKLTAKTDLIIGIGSGVIQDLCKYVSF